MTRQADWWINGIDNHLEINVANRALSNLTDLAINTPLVLDSGQTLGEDVTISDEGFAVTGTFHVNKFASGVAGNLCLHEGTTPIIGLAGDVHRIWANLNHDILWQNHLGESYILHHAGNAGQWELIGNNISYGAGSVIIDSANGIVYDPGSDINTTVVTVNTSTPATIYYAPATNMWVTNAAWNLSSGAMGVKYRWFNLNDGISPIDVWGKYGTPETDIAASIGSLAIDTNVGNLYLKTTDIIDTGWKKILKTDDSIVVDAITATGGESYEWNLSYSWGDHAGLYDLEGTALSLLVSHSITFNHSNYDTAYSWGNHAGLYEASGGIATHAAIANAHHSRYTDAEAIIAVQNEATLEFQQPTTIGTKSGAGVLTLESVGNSLILQAGIDIRLKDDVLLFDNKLFWIGTSKDYWFDYSVSGARYRFWSSNIDGSGTDGVIYHILDGTRNVQFLGGVQVDAINEYTAASGVNIEGTVFSAGSAYAFNIEKSKITALAARIYNTNLSGVGEFTVGASGGGHINLIANSSDVAYKGIPSDFCGIAADWGGAIIFAVGDSGPAAEKMRLTEVGGLTIKNRMHVQGSESSGGVNAAIELENIAAGGDRWFFRAGATGASTPAGAFSIADTSAYRFIIDEDGKVGIGIGATIPSAKLEVGGNIALSGTVDGRDVAADGTKLDGVAVGAEVATKEYFISAGEAILSSNASYPTPNDTYHLALADGVTFARCFFVFRLPSDFSSMASGYPKVVFKQGTGGTGNYRIAFDSRAGGVGQQLGSVLDTIAEYTMAAPGISNEIWEEDVSACFDDLSLTSGKYVGLRIQRDSDDSLDTFVGDLDVVGIDIKYS